MKTSFPNAVANALPLRVLKAKVIQEQKALALRTTLVDRSEILRSALCVKLKALSK